MDRRTIIIRAWRAVVAVTAVGALLAACGGGGGGGTDAPPFVVVAGEPGVALVDATGLTPLPGLEVRDVYQGPLAVALDGERAVVKGSAALGVVTRGSPPRVVECADCSGVAVVDGEIVTTRKNYTPDEGFDIVRFDDDLTQTASVSAARLVERAGDEFAAENIESPVTLAADADGVVVGYLARAGGSRRGPTIIARYDAAGTLVASTRVEGILGRSTVSPDGRLLGVGVGGSGGACITTSDPVVVDLRTLQVTPIRPEIPAAFPTDTSTLSPPWFQLTDLRWDGDALTATGEVHALADDELCDSDPQVWRRTFAPDGGEPADLRVETRGERWVGPGCAEVVAVAGGPDAAMLDRRPAGPGALGAYDRLGPGPAAPAECGSGT